MGFCGTNFFRNPLSDGLDPTTQSIIELRKATEDLASRDVIFVNETGAIGDDITDDTVAIQAALDSGRTNIFFPPGTYKLTSDLRIPSNRKLVGYNATLKCYPGSLRTAANKSDGTVGGYGANKNITIEGLKITESEGADSSGFGFSHVTGLNIINCEFYGFAGWHPIEINACKQVRIEGCYFHHYGLPGSETMTEMIQLDVADSMGYFPAFGPYDGTVCDGVEIVNCTFENPVSLYESIDAGWYPAAIGNHSVPKEDYHKNITISGCNFINLQRCIHFVSADKITIANNHARNVDSFLRVTSTTMHDACIIGNTIVSTYRDTSKNEDDLNCVFGNFTGSQFIGNYIFGFHSCGLNVRGHYNTISGNTVQECKRYGILTGTNSSHINITGNVCVGNDIAGIRIYSDGSEEYMIGGFMINGNLCTDKISVNTSVGSLKTFITGNSCDELELVGASRHTTSNNLVDGVMM